MSGYVEGRYDGEQWTFARGKHDAGSSQPADIEKIRSRNERCIAFMQSAEPEGMVSKPHICRWSDDLSHATRDVTTLLAALDAVAAELAELRHLKAAVEEYLAPSGAEWYVACNERTKGKHYPAKAALARAALSRGATP